jgi:hypothetical protein
MRVGTVSMRVGTVSMWVKIVSTTAFYLYWTYAEKNGTLAAAAATERREGQRLRCEGIVEESGWLRPSQRKVNGAGGSNSTCFWSVGNEEGPEGGE